MKPFVLLKLATLALLAVVPDARSQPHVSGPAIFNVKDYAATGRKADDARPAIQRAIDACAVAGGGIVRVPPGDYTAGTLHLRSQVQFEIQAGATVFASLDPKAYEFGQVPSKAALFFGEDLENVSISGAGTVDGQAEYEWREDDFEHAFDHKTQMQAMGKSLMRSFPKGFPQRQVFPHLVWLGRSRNVQISGLKFVRSPSWTLALYACERAVFEHLDIRSSLKEAVWADGIDLDGCKEVSVSHCTIETGDDCIVFISAEAWGPALPCENITVRHCRLSSASAGVKFSEGNKAGIRGVVVRDTVLTNVNRGFVFSTTLGGSISDVLLAHLTIDCRRFDWFWAGDGQPFHFRITRLSEFNKEPLKPGEPPPGAIRNVTIRDVRARAAGSSLIHGHADSWLEGICLENVKVRLAADSLAPFDKAEHALDFRRARNLKVKSVAVSWGKPALEAWKSALYFEDVQNLELDGFVGRGAWPDRDAPALVLNQVSNAVVHHSRASDGTRAFLKVTGSRSGGVCLQGNDLRNAEVPCQIDKGLRPDAVRMLEGRFPK
ncbi:MAG: right-handed parallel beta-helix repeat-containing protein [Verrucomicrobia bacterium]|nr:right-handed parallel beta-helix repeat-containing protein [Verrucomicrobiota bacterium]